MKLIEKDCNWYGEKFFLGKYDFYLKKNCFLYLLNIISAIMKKNKTKEVCKGLQGKTIYLC